MDYRIWKYEFNIKDRQVVLMPKGAQILSAANQNGTLCIWALVDTVNDDEARHIEIIGTGNPVPHDMGVERKFIGTVMMPPFVWHVFELL